MLYGFALPVLVPPMVARSMTDAIQPTTG